MVKKLYSVPEEPTLPVRAMVKKDIAGVTKLINNGLEYVWNNLENTKWNSTTPMKKSSITSCPEKE